MKVFDLHCDTLSELRYAEEAGQPKSFAENDLQIDLKKLQKGDYMLQCFAAFVNLARPGQDPLVAALEEIDIFKRIMAKYSDFIAPVYQPEDIRKNAEAGKISGMLTIEEGGCCKGSLGVLRLMHELGVRMMTLTWNHENELASPNVVPGADTDTIWPCQPNTKTGLKEKGFEFLAEMERLHIIADVSHLSDKGFWDIAEHSTRPFAASHSNCRALAPHCRNLTDEMIRAMADAGRPGGPELLLWLPGQPAGRVSLPQHRGPDGKARGALSRKWAALRSLVWAAILTASAASWRWTTAPNCPCWPRRSAARASPRTRWSASSTGTHSASLRTICKNKKGYSKMDQNMTLEKRIAAELYSYQGKMSVFVDDLQGHTVEMGADEEFETASTIKAYILAVLYLQASRGKASLTEEIEYQPEHFVDGSGMLRALGVGAKLKVKDTATMMIICSDNIATNMIIDYLGLDTINACIKELGFAHTVLHNPLHFDRYEKLGTTTPRDYASLFAQVAKGTLVSAEASAEMLAIFRQQHYNTMLTHDFPQFYLDCEETGEPELIWVASKSGSMNACRNDGGIIHTPYGEYVIVLMNKDFHDIIEYDGHPAMVYGARVSRMIFDQILACEGKLYQN